MMLAMEHKPFMPNDLCDSMSIFRNFVRKTLRRQSSSQTESVCRNWAISSVFHWTVHC